MAKDFDQTDQNISVREEKPVLGSPASARSEVPYPRLEMVAGPEEGLVFRLTEGEHLLGRSREKVPLHLSDTSVSRLHARLAVKGEAISVEDMGSRNGTFVNGRRLKKGESLPLTHLDQLKAGIYDFRVALRPVAEEEQKSSSQATYVAINEEKPAKKEEKNLLLADAGPEGVSGELSPEDKKELIPSPLSRFHEEPLGVRLKVVFAVIGILSILGGLAYFHLVWKGRTSPPSPSVLAPSVPSPPPEEREPTERPTVQAPPVKSPSSSVVSSFQAFLDIQSRPLPARVSLGDRTLGETPLKAPVTLEPGKEVTVIAEFDLKDVHDRYQQKMTFVADVRKEVIPLLFDAEIASLKVLRLPRSVNFYLEGTYAYDRQKTHPVKLTDIIYGQPIYVPYGHYVVELREKVRVGDAETYADETRFRREFDLDASRRTVELTVNDRDLQFFPAKISSVPSGADVIVDGEKMGTTPFSGDLPLGRHTLKLTREGYFDHEAPIEMRTNIPFESTIELKTSRAGELVNRSRELTRADHFAEAIDQLVEALKLSSGGREKAEIHLLLGENYFRQGNTSQALAYFEQAKSSSDFYLSALLGTAKSQNAVGNKNAALPLLVEVLLNVSPNDPLKREALGLFKQVSPIKSVLYISSEPSGAEVLINGRPVGQVTPVILSDLALGAYRIEINKQGYASQQVKQNLKLGEFVPVIVKLAPEKL